MITYTVTAVVKIASNASNLNILQRNMTNFQLSPVYCLYNISRLHLKMKHCRLKLGIASVVSSEHNK